MIADEPATADAASYDAGWHDGVDYGYRLAERELDTCPHCERSRSDHAAIA